MAEATYIFKQRVTLEHPPGPPPNQQAVKDELNRRVQWPTHIMVDGQDLELTFLESEDDV